MVSMAELQNICQSTCWCRKSHTDLRASTTAFAKSIDRKIGRLLSVSSPTLQKTLCSRNISTGKVSGLAARMRQRDGNYEIIVADNAIDPLISFEHFRMAQRFLARYANTRTKD